MCGVWAKLRGLNAKEFRGVRRLRRKLAKKALKRAA